MKIRYLIALSLLVVSAPAVSQDVITYLWDPGCNHTMTTNHFMLAPGQEVEVEVDLSKCSEAQIGSLLFFGYVTTKTRSRQLRAKDRVQLSMSPVFLSGNLGVAEHSNSGSLLVDVADVVAKGCRMKAKNNSRKVMKIRLRGQLISQ